MKTHWLIRMLVLLLPVAFVGTACGRQVEHKSKVIRIHEGDSDRGWLGVSITDVTSSEAKKKDLKVEEGALVRDVEDDSPADSAGIKEGDVITEFDGKKISDASDLSNDVGKTKPGTVVNVTVMRNNEKKSLKATIGKPPHESMARVFTVPPVPHPPGGMFMHPSTYGLSLQELNEQLGQYFEAPGGKGVLVDNVKKNSKGEEAGFKAGDVIVRVGKESVADVDDIRHALKNSKDGDKVEVEVLRKGAHKTLSLVVDKSEQGFGYDFRFHGWPFNGEEMNFNIDVPDHEQMEEFRHQKDNLKLQMDQLKKELQNIPKDIKESLKGLDEKVREAVKAARLNKSV